MYDLRLGLFWRTKEVTVLLKLQDIFNDVWLWMQHKNLDQHMNVTFTITIRFAVYKHNNCFGIRVYLLSEWAFLEDKYS